MIYASSILFFPTPVKAVFLCAAIIGNFCSSGFFIKENRGNNNNYFIRSMLVFSRKVAVERFFIEYLYHNVIWILNCSNYMQLEDLK